jgi:TPR repeat protein
MKKIYVVCLLMLMAAGTARADFNDGVVAYIGGDYETAYNTMISISKTDEKNALAQYYLGMMYFKGQGVEKNYEEAGKWFRKAAENRLPQAQYKLAELYTDGEGVPRDFEFAYIWYSVGAAHKHKLSQNAVEKARTKLSKNELGEADKMVAEFIGKYGPTKEDAAQAQPVASKPKSE